MQILRPPKDNPHCCHFCGGSLSLAKQPWLEAERRQEERVGGQESEAEMGSFHEGYVFLAHSLSSEALS